MEKINSKTIFVFIICLAASGLLVLYYFKDKEKFIELSSANFAIINPSTRFAHSGQALSTDSTSTSAATLPATTSQATSTSSVQATTSAPLVNNIKANFSDLSGQIVKHLFNINSVPSPKAVAITLDGKEIWATMLLNKTRGVAVFDSTTGKNTANINLNNGGGVEIVFSADGSLAYVSQMETAKVFEIDTAAKKVLRVFDTKSSWTKFLILSRDGKTIYASNWVGNNVSEINLEIGKLVRQIPTVKTPRGLYVTGDGKFLYVAGFDKGEIEKIDLKTDQGKIVYKNGGAMRHIIADEEKGMLYISDMGTNTIFQLSLVSDEVKKFATTDVNPNTIALSPDKKILFVSCRGINASADNYYVPGPEWGSVLLFDTETGQMLDAIVGGNQPTALDISKNGQMLVFSDFLDSRLEIFQVPPYEILKLGQGGRSSVYKSELKK